MYCTGEWLLCPVGCCYSLRWIMSSSRGKGPSLWFPRKSSAVKAASKLWGVTCTCSQPGGSCNTWDRDHIHGVLSAASSTLPGFGNGSKVYFLSLVFVSLSVHPHSCQPPTPPWDLHCSLWPWSHPLLQAKLPSHSSQLPVPTLWSGLRLVSCLWDEKNCWAAFCVFCLLRPTLRFHSSSLVPPERGFPSVWKLFLLHDSFPPQGHKLLS